MHQFFKAFLTVSFNTTISRILGFIRDILIAKYIGSTVIADSFFIAFRLPNFFRRVLAEGAYSAAFIPIFSGLVNDSKENKKADIFVENTMSILFIFTTFLTAIFYFNMPLVIQFLAPGFTKNIEAFNLAVHFGKIMFPYIIFISLVSHFVSVMNVHGKFAAGSISPAILNLSFIFSLIFLTPKLSTAGHALSYGLLIGGFFQFFLMYKTILKIYKPRLIFPKFNFQIKRFFLLFIPGVFGAGVIQLNIIIGTMIASILPIGAISHIYYADRLNQLPLAIFGIAMGIVLLPSLSKAIKKNNTEKIHTTQNRSLEFSLLIALPSAIGLYILSFPIIHILFERGAFVEEDTFYTAKVLSIFALGLPAYILTKVLVTCFFAREDTKTPLYVSIITVITNVVLSILLISTMREMGIALATAISAWINSILLYVFLKIRNHINLDNRFKLALIKIIISSAIMGIVCYYVNLSLFLDIAQHGGVVNVLALILSILICNIVYLVMIFVLKVISIDELKEYIKK